MGLSINTDVELNGNLILPKEGSDIHYWHAAKDFPLQTIDGDGTQAQYVDNGDAKQSINYWFMPNGANSQIRWSWFPWAFGETGWQTYRLNFGWVRTSVADVTPVWKYYELTRHFGDSMVDTVPLVATLDDFSTPPALGSGWLYSEIVGNRPVELDGNLGGIIYSILERDYASEAASNTADFGVMRVTATRQS